MNKYHRLHIPDAVEVLRLDRGPAYISMRKMGECMECGADTDNPNEHMKQRHPDIPPPSPVNQYILLFVKLLKQKSMNEGVTFNTFLPVLDPMWEYGDKIRPGVIIRNTLGWVVICFDNYSGRHIKSDYFYGRYAIVRTTLQRISDLPVCGVFVNTGAYRDGDEVKKGSDVHDRMEKVYYSMESMQRSSVKEKFSIFLWGCDVNNAGQALLILDEPNKVNRSTMQHFTFN